MNIPAPVLGTTDEPVGRGGGRLVAVCDYVALPFEAVKDVLAGPGVQELIGAALNAVLEPDLPQLSVECSPPDAIGRTVARTRVVCGIPGHVDREPIEATITALAVLSGTGAVTELLVNVRVPDDFAPRAAAIARRFLDRLTTSLTGHGATRY